MTTMYSMCICIDKSIEVDYYSMQREPGTMESGPRESFGSIFTSQMVPKNMIAGRCYM